MPLSVPDLLTHSEPLFAASIAPGRKLEMASQTIHSRDGWWKFLDKPMRLKDQCGFSVQSAVQLDGFDVMSGLQVWGLFNPARKATVSEWEFAQYRTNRILKRIEDIADKCLSAAPWAYERNITVLFLPSDHANANMMVRNSGVSVYASIPGYILLQLWPSSSNLGRLDHIISWAFAVQLRASSTDCNTLAEHILRVGIGHHFSQLVTGREVHPFAPPFSLPLVQYKHELDDIALMLGAASFGALQVNTYGAKHVAQDYTSFIAPDAVNKDSFSYATMLTREYCNDDDPNLIAAILYGDDAVTQTGHDPAGVERFAGYQVGSRIVEYLSRQPKFRLEDLFRCPAEQLLDSALSCL